MIPSLSFALPLSLLGTFGLTLAAVPTAQVEPGPGKQLGEGPQNCSQIFFSDEYGPADALWASPNSAPHLQIPKIVLGNGDTLTEVEVKVTALADGSLGIENTTAGSCVAFPEWSISMGVEPLVPMTGLQLVPFEASQLLTSSLDPYDNLLDYDGGSGETIVLPPNLSFENVVTLTSDLGDFIDSAPNDGEPEHIEFSHFTIGDGRARSSCSVEVLWSAQASIKVEFLYTVCSTSSCPTVTVLASGADGRIGHVNAGDLAILYSVRDKPLSASAVGKELTRTFYKHAAEAHILFLNHPDLRQRAGSLLRSLLPKLEDAVEGRSASLTSSEQRSINILMRDLALFASPELKATLARLRRDLSRGSLGDLVGLGR
jgi:hypothetical protein